MVTITKKELIDRITENTTSLPVVVWPKTTTLLVYTFVIVLSGI